MSKSVLADFTAQATHADTEQSAPCRVVLSRTQLVVVTQQHRRQIELTQIFDIVVSRIPAELAEFFDQSVLVGYVTGPRRQTVLIEGDHEQIDKFGMFLYKAVLHQTEVQVKHPARLGGRVVDSQAEPAQVSLTPHAVTFERESEPFSIELSMITNIEYVTRTVEETPTPIVSVRHMSDGQAVTTEISHDSERRLNVLTRYLRLRYFRLEEEVQTLELTDQEAAGLVALYSGGEPERIDSMLELDEPTAEALLQQLVEKKLIEDLGGELTDRGRMVVSNRIDEIND